LKNIKHPKSAGLKDWLLAMSEQLAMFAPSNGLGGHKELSIIDRNVVVIARNAQQTSVKAALRAQPRSGTKRRLVFDYLRTHDATDEEIERALNISGNTVRPIRGSLVKDGLIVDSGARRLTIAGNEAIVWSVK